MFFPSEHHAGEDPHHLPNKYLCYLLSDVSCQLTQETFQLSNDFPALLLSPVSPLSSQMLLSSREHKPCHLILVANVNVGEDEYLE